jgi:hypothetical protein
MGSEALLGITVSSGRTTPWALCHVCVDPALEQLDGATPLFVASFGGNVEIVKALLADGANVKHVKVSGVYGVKFFFR